MSLLYLTLCYAILFRCIAQCSVGRADKKVVGKLTSWCVSVPPTDAVYLAPLNSQVDLYNAQRLAATPGELIQVVIDGIWH